MLFIIFFFFLYLHLYELLISDIERTHYLVTLGHQVLQPLHYSSFCHIPSYSFTSTFFNLRLFTSGLSKPLKGKMERPYKKYCKIILTSTYLAVIAFTSSFAFFGYFASSRASFFSFSFLTYTFTIYLTSHIFCSFLII